MWSDAAGSLSLSCTPVSAVDHPLTSSSCWDGSQPSGKWRGWRSAPKSSAGKGWIAHSGSESSHSSSWGSSSIWRCNEPVEEVGMPPRCAPGEVPQTCLSRRRPQRRPRTRWRLYISPRDSPQRSWWREVSGPPCWGCYPSDLDLDECLEDEDDAGWGDPSNTSTSFPLTNKGCIYIWLSVSGWTL